MNLAIDIGNTLVKLAVFDKGQMTGLQTLDEISVAYLQQFTGSHPGIDASIIASVRDFPSPVQEFLQNKFSPYPF